MHHTQHGKPHIVIIQPEDGHCLADCTKRWYKGLAKHFINFIYFSKPDLEHQDSSNLAAVTNKDPRNFLTRFPSNMSMWRVMECCQILWLQSTAKTLLAWI